jgi:hypothetical protein
MIWIPNIRDDGLDPTALARISESLEMPRNYVGEPIAGKMDALRIINHRITTLGLDTHVDTSPYLMGG